MKLFASFVFICAMIFIVKAQVASKLDLDGSKEETSTSKSPSLRSSSNSGSNNKVSPKIEGVRVTVDTGDGKKTKEAESNESIEIIDNKSTKRVGIHTDITFEITDDKNDANVTSSERGEKDNDASIPIFKGRTTTRRPQARLPYNPKIYVNYPNQPGYNPGGGVGGGRDHYNGHSIPAFPGTNDEGIYRSIDDRWSNVIPINNGGWTTERSSYYIPSRSYHHHHSQHQQQPQQQENYDVNYRSYPGNSHYNAGGEQLHYLQARQQLASGPGVGGVGGDSWQPCVCINGNDWKESKSIRSFRSAAERKLNPQVALVQTSYKVSSKIRK